MVGDESGERTNASDLVLSIDEVRRTFTIEDVTNHPDRLNWAFDLIVQGYLPMSSQTLDPGEIREEVCDDSYHRHGFARTLVLTGRHPETGELEPLGTVRINVAPPAARDLGLHPMETMGLMVPRGGWERFAFEGFVLDQVAEGARLAVSPTCRIGRSREIGLASVVLRALVEEGFRFARERYNRSQYWGILPYYVRERFESLGVSTRPAPDMLFRADENPALFAKYRSLLAAQPAAVLQSRRRWVNRYTATACG